MSVNLPLFQVDAFAARPFEGNPAAVCPLQAWLADDVLQNIAAENNLAETAFFTREKNGFHLRWFTPEVEVEFCGHATLASAHVLFSHLDYQGEEILFHTKRGEFFVRRAEAGMLAMDLPAEPHAPAPMLAALGEVLGAAPDALYRGPNYMAVFAGQDNIATLAPDMAALKKILMADNAGLICTAPGEGKYDFVSRFFAPAHGIDEDSATGSAHCMLAPFWAEKLEKNQLAARQLSRRGADIFCIRKSEARVILKGKCVDYMQGEIKI